MNQNFKIHVNTILKCVFTVTSLTNVKIQDICSVGLALLFLFHSVKLSYVHSSYTDCRFYIYKIM